MICVRHHWYADQSCPDCVADATVLTGRLILISITTVVALALFTGILMGVI